MGRGGAKVCTVCYNLIHKCTCRCPRCGKTLPDCKCPADSPAPPPPPPEDDLDPFVQSVMMAYHDRAHHKTWIDALAAKELCRKIDRTPSPYSKAIQPYVRALVQHSMEQLLAGTRVEMAAERHTRLLAPPPRPRTAPRAVAPPVGEQAVSAAFVHKQHLAAYYVLPELIDGLTDFLTIWRSSTAPVTGRCGTPESFSTFFTTSSILNQTVFLKPQFWSNAVAKWTAAPRDENGASVDSPYFPAHGYQPSQRGSPSGSNTWLDRFLHARCRFRNAAERVVFHPFFIAATQDNDEAQHPQRIPQLHEFPPQLVADLTTLKCEFAALFALCCCPLTLPVHDFSLDGRDRDSKWFAAAGGFRLWTSETAHEHLSDPQDLRERLRGLNELRYVGRTLADLPGVFPDVEGRINVTLARMRKKQIEGLALTISDSKTNPMRDPDQRHPDLDDAFYNTVARLQESTRSAKQDPVRVAQSAQWGAAEIEHGLARMRQKLHPDDWYNGPLSSGRTVYAREVYDKYAARPKTSRFELLEDDTETKEREAREDRRLRDNLQADDDAIQAVMDYTAPNAAGMSQEQIDGAVDAISALALVPTSDEYPLEAGASSRAAGGAAKRARQEDPGRSHRFLLPYKDDFDRNAPDYDARMRTVTPEQVVKYSFNQNHVVAALDVRGVRLPGMNAADRKQMLLILLMQVSPEIRIAMFAAKGFTLRDLGGGLWNCWRTRK